MHFPKHFWRMQVPYYSVTSDSCRPQHYGPLKIGALSQKILVYHFFSLSNLCWCFKSSPWIPMGQQAACLKPCNKLTMLHIWVFSQQLPYYSQANINYYKSQHQTCLSRCSASVQLKCSSIQRSFYNQQGCNMFREKKKTTKHSCTSTWSAFVNHATQSFALSSLC